MQKKALIRVVLADDHPIILSGYGTALQPYGVSVIGTASTPEAAVEVYRAKQPEVLVLDVRFGEKSSGLDAARTILSEFADAKIIFLSQFEQDALVKEAYRLGAYAFITKNNDAELLAQAIKHVQQGGKYFLPQVATRLAELAIHGDSSPQALLEPRELEVFILLARGATYAEIAQQLDLSIRTVNNISQLIREKLGVQRMADITILALQHGLLEPQVSI